MHNFVYLLEVAFFIGFKFAISRHICISVQFEEFISFEWFLNDLSLFIELFPRVTFVSTTILDSISIKQ